LGVGHENLRDFIATREFHYGLGDIGAAKNLRFDLEAPREEKVLLYSLSFLRWKLR
jgi:hypothetical protein